MRKHIVSSGLPALLLAAGLAFGQENYTANWSGHSYLNLNTSAVPANNGVAIDTTLRQFPMLVRLAAADSTVFAQSRGNGADIRFTKLDNTTRLHHSIDHWDSTGRRAAIWVLMDTIHPHSRGSRLRMHWGNPTAADSSRPGAVFDTANGYIAVWHMGGDTSTVARANSVPGGEPAVPSGNTANLASGWKRHAGIIGLADTLRGSTGTGNTAKANGDHLNLGATGARDFSGGFTISMWMKPTEDPAYSGWMQYISFSNGQANNNIWMGRRGDGMNFTAEYYAGTSTGGHIDVDGAQTYDQWGYLVWTLTGPDLNKLYFNGALGAEQLANLPMDATTTRPQNHIGRSPWGDRNIVGMVDEVRVSRIPRPAPWIKLEYENQKAAQTFVTRSAEQMLVEQDPVSVKAAVDPASRALSFKAMGEGVLFRIRSDKAATARIAILDMQGREVWSRSVETTAGENRVAWNGRSAGGRAVGSGIYLVRMSIVDSERNVIQRLERKLPLSR